jgi:hypothetical protein
MAKPKGLTETMNPSISSGAPAATPTLRVRVYEVVTTVVPYDFTQPVFPKYKGCGDKLTSTEFIAPPGVTADDLEKRLVEIGAIRLVG